MEHHRSEGGRSEGARPHRSEGRGGNDRRREGGRREAPAPPPKPPAYGPAQGPAHGPTGGSGPTQGSDVEVDTRRPLVGVVMGSDSDLPVVRRCIDVLEQFDVPYEAEVLSAHRTPERAHEYASTARMRGLKVIIAAAGGAAHLAGVMASLTTLPVIGIPMQSVLGGADSLYSTVQMPAGIPVATVAIGEAGATNAGLLAAQILALSDDELMHRLQVYRADLRNAVAQKNDRMRAQLSEPR